jgi:hypothetical protein
MLLSEGQLNDHVGARLIFDAMPHAKVLIADKGYDSDDFREALEECGGILPFDARGPQGCALTGLDAKRQVEAKLKR